MLGNYPVLIDGEETGTLTVTRDGLMTVFDVRCKAPDTLLRLSVYGETEGYLGVLAPDGDGGARLHKRFSRAEMKAFPQTIRCASRAGDTALLSAERADIAENNTEEDPAEEAASAPAEEAGTALPSETETECADAAASDEALSAATHDVPTEAEKTHSSETEAAEPELVWRRGAGGALVGVCGGARFLAVPLKTGVEPVGGNFERRRIEGTEYAVFEIKNGKIN